MLPNRCRSAMLQAEKYGITLLQKVRFLFPLAIEICVPDTSGDSVFQVLQIIRIHSCGTRIMMKISYHKQYHGDTAAY